MPDQESLPVEDGDPKPKAQSNRDADIPVTDHLQALSELDYAALNAEWRRRFRARPPKRVGRNLLILGIAWKIQERAYGGLSAAMKRQIGDLAENLDTDGHVPRRRTVQLKPGARLVREWHGETHDVLVLEDGFQWRGQHWRSLSQIAREITGTPWSGPRFFGLLKAGPRDLRDEHNA